MGRDMRIVKFRMFIKEIWETMGNESLVGKTEDVAKNKMVGAITSTAHGGGIWLALIFDYNELNEYGKIIMEVASDFNNEYLDDEIELFEEYEDEEYRINEAEKFIEGFNRTFRSYDYRRKSMKCAFIFWALMILTVDDTDKEEHLSQICDFVRMLKLTDEDVEDMVQIIRVIYHKAEGECRLNNSFKDTCNEYDYRKKGVRFRELLKKYADSSVKITDRYGKNDILDSFKV